MKKIMAGDVKTSDISHILPPAHSVSTMLLSPHRTPKPKRAHLALILIFSSCQIGTAAKFGKNVKESEMPLPVEELKKSTLLSKMFPMISKMFVR